MIDKILRLEALGPRPSTPFDLEPSMFDESPIFSLDQAERLRQLQEQYDAIRLWHARRDYILMDGVCREGETK